MDMENGYLSVEEMMELGYIDDDMESMEEVFYIDPISGKLYGAEITKESELRSIINTPELKGVVKHLIAIAKEREKAKERLSEIEKKLNSNLTPRQKTIWQRKRKEAKERLKELNESFYTKLFELPSEIQVIALEYVHYVTFKDFFAKKRENSKKEKLTQVMEEFQRRVEELKRLNPNIEIKLTVSWLKKTLNLNSKRAKLLKEKLESMEEKEKKS